MNWVALDKHDQQFRDFVAENFRPFLFKSRWYVGKGNVDKKILVDHLIPLDHEGIRFYLLILEIIYNEGFVHNYMVPISLVGANEKIDESARIAQWADEDTVLIDAMHDPRFRNALMALLSDGVEIPFGDGHLRIDVGKSFLESGLTAPINSELVKAEQSNTTIIYEGQFYLKMYRRLFRHENPDIEMSQYLSEHCNFKNVPAFGGSITWVRHGLYNISIGLMQQKVSNKGDAWEWMGQRVKEFFESIQGKRINPGKLKRPGFFEPKSLDELPKVIQQHCSSEMLEGLKLISRRTADMHISLAQERVNRNFTRKNYTSDFAVWIKNHVMEQFNNRYALLDRQMNNLSGQALEYAQYFYGKKSEIRNRIFSFDDEILTGVRIRIHGDYHLGQILYTGDDFVILDFEGEPESTIHDRRVKQSPLKDVAGMFRSIHYSIYAYLFNAQGSRTKGKSKQFEIGEWLYEWMTSIFLDQYLKQAFQSNLNIGYLPEIRFMLKYHLLEKAIYELGYELNARPSWSIIPLRGIHTLLYYDKDIE